MPLKIPDKAKMYINMARLPMDMGAAVVAGLDANDTGTDDLAAAIIHYVSSVLGALVMGQPLPAIPQQLVDTVGTTGEASQDKSA